MAANLPYNATLAGAMGGICSQRSATPLAALSTITANAAGIAHAAASIANEVGTVQVASLVAAVTTADQQACLQACARAVVESTPLSTTSDTDTSVTFASIATEIIGLYNAVQPKITA